MPGETVFTLISSLAISAANDFDKVVNADFDTQYDKDPGIKILSPCKEEIKIILEELHVSLDEIGVVESFN